MKKFFLVSLVLLAAAAFSYAEGIAEEARKGNEKADMSYAFGIVVASDITGTGLEFNYDAFIRGFRQIMEKGEADYTMDEAVEKIQAAFQKVQSELGAKNLAAGEAFLAENGKRPGVITTPSGLQYEALVEGNGKTPGAGDTVRVHYHGTLIDETVFDTTREIGEPVEFPLDAVIPGWSEGIRMMKEGGKAMLYLPSNLAYGERGAGGAIGPNSVLVFEVELFSVVESGEAPQEADGTLPE